MKSILCITLITAFTFGVSVAAHAAQPKNLVVYFSWSGNTKAIATQIHDKVGGDMIEIEMERPYSDDYNTCLDEAKKDQAAKARPAIKTRIENLDQYDTIFLGYPNWWATIPMPVATLLEQHDFSGKTIVPFCSHGGGRLGQSVTEIAKIARGAQIREALSVHYGGGGSLSADIDAWLGKNGISS